MTMHRFTLFATGLLGDGSLGVLPLVDATNPATTTPAPSMPATGAGGMASEGTSSTTWVIALGAVLALTMTTGGLVLARRSITR